MDKDVDTIPDEDEPISAYCTNDRLVVTLTDLRQISIPLWWYPTLFNATAVQRANIELMPSGMHWPDIDEDISVEHMLAGVKARGAKEPVKA